MWWEQELASQLKSKQGSKSELGLRLMGNGQWAMGNGRGEMGLSRGSRGSGRSGPSGGRMRIGGRDEGYPRGEAAGRSPRG
jgi:hypothetical protein